MDRSRIDFKLNFFFLKNQKKYFFYKVNFFKFKNLPNYLDFYLLNNNDGCVENDFISFINKNDFKRMVEIDNNIFNLKKINIKKKMFCKKINIRNKNYVNLLYF